MSARTHICPECNSHLVQALEAEEAGPEAWHVRLRCPECWFEWGSYLSDRQIEAYELDFARGVGVLSEMLERLALENMAYDVERFAAALEADAIVPMDF